MKWLIPSLTKELQYPFTIENVLATEKNNNIKSKHSKKPCKCVVPYIPKLLAARRLKLRCWCSIKGTNRNFSHHNSYFKFMMPRNCRNNDNVVKIKEMITVKNAQSGCLFTRSNYEESLKELLLLDGSGDW